MEFDDFTDADSHQKQDSPMETPTQSFGRNVRPDAQGFPSSPVELKPGKPAGQAVDRWGKAVIIMIIAVGTGSIVGLYSLELGQVFILLGLLWAMMTVFGIIHKPEDEVVADYMAEGPCPHCGAPIHCLNEEGRAGSCPTCEHRLVYRNQRLVDVSA